MSAAAYCRWLFAVALGVRLVFVLLYPQAPVGQGDDVIYDSIGQSIASGDGFLLAEVTPGGLSSVPQVRVGPVYPLFLGTVYLILGHSITAVRVVQAVLGALTVLLVFRIAALILDEHVARIAAAITALYPALILYTGVVLTETLFAFTLTGCVWLAVEAVQRRSTWWWAAAGCALGVSVLLRTEAVVMAPLFLAALLRYGAPETLIGGALALTTAAALTVAPWTARNYYHYRELILVSAHGGPTLWISAVGWRDWHFDDPEYRSLIGAAANDRERSRILQRDALRKIQGDPAGYLRLCLRRVFDLWIGSHTTYFVGFDGSFGTYYGGGEVARVAVKAVMLALNTVVVLLGLLGIIAAFSGRVSNRAGAALCAIPVVAVAVVHFFLYAGARYHVPVLPFVIIFAALAAVRSVERMRARPVAIAA
jgi:4-amino-4-deoxy-L-arabinose transferase-like glycosyltransferase